MRLTPHESHVLGDVDGETRCLVCLVAPEWPLIESECELASVTTAQRQAILRGVVPRERAERRQITADEWAYVHAQRGDGVAWARIAAEMGRRESSLRRSYGKWLAGEGRVGRMRKNTARSETWVR